MPRATSTIVAVVVAALLAAGCASGSTRRGENGRQPSSAAGGSRPPASTLQWEKCGEVECATLGVPLAPNDPAKGTIDLALVRHRATGERTGVLLTNPGGPGAAALWIAQQAGDIFPDQVLEHFDVIAWD